VLRKALLEALRCNEEIEQMTKQSSKLYKAAAGEQKKLEQEIKAEEDQAAEACARAGKAAELRAEAEREAIAAKKRGQPPAPKLQSRTGRRISSQGGIQTCHQGRRQTASTAVGGTPWRHARVYAHAAWTHATWRRGAGGSTSTERERRESPAISTVYLEIASCLVF